MKFNKILLFSLLIFIILATIVYAIITSHNPIDRTGWSPYNASVTITCDAGIATTYIRHCWSPLSEGGNCDPGEIDVSTCYLTELDPDCVVNTSENNPDDNQWYLCSKCKNADTWSIGVCTGYYAVDNANPTVYFTPPVPQNNKYSSSSSLKINATIFDGVSDAANMTFVVVKQGTGEVNRTSINIVTSGNYSLNFT
ncbi:MAG: hypothetical protein KJ767_01590, partial [Nanoarchaeota archaeon]|nr:hypothetical protein [Nanoarchaeota archaeon]